MMEGLTREEMVAHKPYPLPVMEALDGVVEPAKLKG